MKRLFLVDGMAIVYRAHFAFAVKPIMTSKGLNTSAIYGFANTLTDLIKNQNPTHMAVVFDTEAPTQRHVDFPEYKAQREAMPEELSAALPYVRRLITAMNIPVITKDGYEADDIIGTLAKRAEPEGFDTFMVTPDKDFGQLVSPHIFIYKPGRMGDAAEILGVPEILAKWGIERIDQVIDILGLWGDASDNIPGVRGIGEKTAQKLIAQFGSMENLLANTAQLKGKQKESLEANREMALLSKKLATILLDVPIEVDWTTLERRDFDHTAVEALCTELEFNSLRKRLLGDEFRTGNAATTTATSPAAAAVAAEKKFSGEFDFGGTPGTVSTKTPAPEPELERASEETAPPILYKTIADIPHTYHLAATPEQRAELVAALEKEKSFCFDLETTSLDTKVASIVGMAFSFADHKAWYVPFPADVTAAAGILTEFRALLENPAIEKVGHNLKYDMGVLYWHGLRVRGPLFDTMLAHCLLEPDQRHTMDYLSQVFLGYAPISITKLIGEKKGKQLNMRDVPVEAVAEYAAEDADVTWQLRSHLTPLLKEKGLERVFYDIECPLVSVLIEVEAQGVLISPPVLAEFSFELEGKIAEVEKLIYADAGTPFNLNSPKQLGEVLFGKLQLNPAAKKTKTGQFSTDEQTLQTLAAVHPIVQRILDYREMTKLKSTYVDTLPGTIFARTGRIHTTFHQALTATGRLNSQDPNLQNIPVRTELGREIRKAFVAPEGDFSLLSADYSQIELRIIAALSEDPGLLEAFQSGEDIHRATAAKVYGVPLADVTSDMRRKAKMVNFGIIYGISAFGLAQRLAIPRKEAAEIIESYFKQYPGVKDYMNRTIAFARENGYVETVTGRRRTLRDITSANANVRGGAERNAINSPIQGTAADMIKIAMIRVQQALNAGNYQTRMILQVHDELLFDLYNPEKDIILPLVEEKMKTAIPTLRVPIVVEMGLGQNWLDAHS
ncbi:MAG: DNA polymerase I [Verrucomicrobia bacterium Tous-C9LFEB]|nr:MAG: DNA polymerase I [Verrucomicrobia bacterium Tous-C9LFEB]